jgi:hypothetical protein
MTSPRENEIQIRPANTRPSVQLAAEYSREKMFVYIFAVLLCLLYKWATSDFDYFEKLGVPFEKPLPLVGNLLDLVLQKRSSVDIYRSSYEKFKNSK